MYQWCNSSWDYKVLLLVLQIWQVRESFSCLPFYFLYIMKYIYTWNQDTNMYDIRLATKDEQILIDNATKLLAEYRVTVQELSGTGIFVCKLLNNPVYCPDDDIKCFNTLNIEEE